MDYKILAEEAYNDIKEAKIEKTGHKIHFSWNDLVKHIKQLEKEIKEVSAKAMVEDAKMKNIEENHNFVTGMSEEELFTAHMYMEAKSALMMCNKYTNERAKQIAEYKEEMEEIKKQVPGLN